MNKVIEIQVEEVKANLDKYILVDVREPHELTGPEGQIEGITLATLGPTLANFLKSADPTKKYVFICKSGFRSEKACEIALTYGFSKVYNMIGGMVVWKGTKKEL